MDLFLAVERAIGERLVPAIDLRAPYAKIIVAEAARAVIEAMRDGGAGSLAMLLAGRRALFSCSEDPELDDARGCWRAMIDAALSEITNMPGEIK